MAETFDPYYKWLGIPPKDQPPNYYRLLAVELFEADADVIASAADQRMAHVRSFQTGKNSAVSQQVLNEIAAARVCLLNAAKKAEYDRQLRARLTALQPPPPAPLPVAVPLPVATPLPPAPLPPAAPLETAASSADEIGLAVVNTASSVSHRSRSGESNWLPRVVALAIIVALSAVGYFAMHGRTKSGDATKQGPAGLALPPVPLPSAASSSKKHHKPKVAPAAPAEAPVLPPLPPVPPAVPAEHAESPSPPPPTEPAPPVAPPVAKPAEPKPVTADDEQQLKASLDAAKTADDFGTCAETGLTLVDRAIAQGDGDRAKGLAVLAVAAARKAADSQLARKASLRYLDAQEPLTDSAREAARRRLQSATREPGRSE